MSKTYYVYILTNAYNTTLYIGVTGNLRKRVYEHISGSGNSFTKKYNLNKLVHYEASEDIKSAIAREKQLKGGSRKPKIALIESTNLGWRDLGSEI